MNRQVCPASGRKRKEHGDQISVLFSMDAYVEARIRCLRLLSRVFFRLGLLRLGWLFSLLSFFSLGRSNYHRLSGVSR